jgi:hypothetical protein
VLPASLATYSSLGVMNFCSTQLYLELLSGLKVVFVNGDPNLSHQGYQYWQLWWFIEGLITIIHYILLLITSVLPRVILLIYY